MDGETNIEQIIDTLYEINDSKAFEIMHRIAALAVKNLLTTEDQEPLQ